MTGRNAIYPAFRDHLSVEVGTEQRPEKLKKVAMRRCGEGRSLKEGTTYTYLLRQETDYLF